ncbi:MAG TPA: hypothetical protein VJO34_02425 [Methylomirabilota bacterium]|nr:hypothetical protein [Methylomirabilota bacterium]
MSDGVLYPSKGRLEGGVSYRVIERGGPVLMTGPDIAHHLLALTLRDLVEGLSAECCWTDVLDEMKSLKPEAVILSSEYFSWLPEECVRRVRLLLREYSVKVVIYFRDELDWQLSRYKQNVKTGSYHRPFRKFIREEYLRYISYERLIQRYADAFGPENIRLRSFEKLRRQSAFEKDFIEILGKDPTRYLGTVREVDKRNVSPPDEVINMIRWLNSVQYHLGNSRFSAGFFRRARQSVFRGGRAYRILRRIAKPVCGRPTVRQQDVRFLQDLNRQWLPDVLDRYLSPDERAFYDINY